MLEHEKIRSAVAGGCAGLASALLTSPIDIIKLRLQNTQSTKITAWTTAKQIYIESGVKGLFRGVSPTIAGYLPAWAIYFSVYDTSKQFFKNEYPELSSVFRHVLSALHAGTLSTVLTNPIWVARTRLLTQSREMKYNSPYHYKSTRDALYRLFVDEGWRSLYKGLGPSMFGVGHVVIQFPLYEQLKTYFNDRYENTGQNIFLSSAISKTIASCITYPHEVVRTRLQTQSELPGSVPKYNSIFQSIKIIYAEEHFRGFYRGFGISLLRTVPASIFTIWTFEYISSHLRESYAQ